MTDLGFVRVVFVAALVVILLQCAVYPVRRIFGMAAAWRLLHWSLYGFLGVVGLCLTWGIASGDLSDGVRQGGWGTIADVALFIGLTMFVSYFMGSRYLADELQRSRAENAGRTELVSGEQEGEA